MTKASENVFREVAAKIGCDLAAIRAVFAVEAAGVYFNSDGSPLRRFEPHHLPRSLWASIGFDPGNVKPWRASLKVSKTRRAKMYREALTLNAEAAKRAASWGAPQIMGFNYAAVGYDSASELVEAFEQPDEQVRAFAEFVLSKGIDSALRAHDWFTFASTYNGNGKAADYAGKIERAYRRFSGGAGSAVILREGSSGRSVVALQERLAELGLLGSDEIDGEFGPKTFSAVFLFQSAEGLVTDGVVGAQTWRQLRDAVPDARIEPRDQETSGDRQVEAVAKYLAPAAGGGVLGRMLEELSPTAELVIVGGFTFAALVVLHVWAIPKIKRAFE
jgi:hypothetical protein